MINIVENYSDQEAWDRYVQTHPQGRFVHTFAYRCIEDVYGYRPNYVAFLQEGEIVGVLPFFEARSRFFGCRLISQPFTEYGGFLLNQDLDDQQFGAIIDYLIELVKRSHVVCLEMHGDQGRHKNSPHIVTANPQQLAVLDLDQAAEEIWQGTISRHVRKAVRKARREQLTVCADISERLIREDFYPMYLQSIARLGSLPHPLSYFLECFRAFGDRQQNVWAIKDGKAIACLQGFTCGRRLSITNIVSDERFWHCRPNDLVHWELIQWACGNGIQHFDFGSVRYDGQSQYKKKWGCDLESSAYFYLVDEQNEHSVETFDSSSRSMGMAGRLWNTLIPRFGGRLLGPALRKQLMR